MMILQAPCVVWYPIFIPKSRHECFKAIWIWVILPKFTYAQHPCICCTSSSLWIANRIGDMDPFAVSNLYFCSPRIATTLEEPIYHKSKIHIFWIQLMTYQTEYLSIEPSMKVVFLRDSRE